MTSRIDMPALGEQVTEGVITRWLKAVGDTVEQGEPLLEVATDKVDTEVPAPYAGTVRELLAASNTTVAVGQPLAIVEPARVPPASPTVKAVTEVPKATAQGATVLSVELPPTVAASSRTEKMSHIRRTIARRMVESLQVSAQLTTVVEANITGLSRLREQRRDAFFQRTSTRLSFLPFFAKAAVEALGAYPMLNATVSPDSAEVTYHHGCHLGLAVDTDRGLMVPVIRDAAELSIEGLARTIADLATRARDGALGVDDLSGATFTLTNTGSRGALFDTPIINQPQTGILATGSAVERVVPRPDVFGGHTLAVCTMVYLSLSYDHRIVDGADAARFLTTLKQRLEDADFAADLRPGPPFGGE